MPDQRRSATVNQQATAPTELRDLSLLNVRDFLEEAVAQVPDSTFLIWGSERISYGAFNERVDAAAAAWYQLGVRKGDRVAFMLENRPEFLQAWLGLAKIGAVTVAINTRWHATEVHDYLDLTEPRFALVGEPYRDVFRAAMASVSELEGVFSIGAGEGFEDFFPFVAKTNSAPPLVELRADDVISFISTSGTTGRSKAVMQTHGNYVLTGEGYAHWVELRAGERMYLCLPLFHINSQAYTVMGAIAARATLVLVERFSASRFWADMAAYGVNVFNFIGSMLVVLSEHEPGPEERRHSVRLTYGGPAFPRPEREQIERRFGLTVISGIGMSECTYGLIEPLHEPRRSGSLGKARQHPDPRIVNEARVVDDHGNDIPNGSVGELIYRNPVMMKGYFRAPEQTVETIRGGWLYTGDLVRRDADGFFYFVDRKKDIIRVRGENVSSTEVEQVLAQHPAVLEVAVIGVPSYLTDEDVAAFVASRAGLPVDVDELVVWSAERLAGFKLPRHIWLVEALPRTETLRIEKDRLRDLAHNLMSEAQPAHVYPRIETPGKAARMEGSGQ